MLPRFGSPDHRTGVEIVDPIENSQFTLYTSESVSPEPADTDPFVYPVSVARRIVTSEITLPYVVSMDVRRQDDGAHICEVSPNSTPELDAGEYLVNLSGPLKIYLRVDSSLSFESTTKGVRIEFGGETTVDIGSRSSHDSPAATITVPDDPRAVMDAVSAFGSALKTTSPERSWPTLRGHPPRIERGDDLQVPDELEMPDTGVTLHVPPEYDHVLPIAPLAYYLGASVVPGEPPRLTTGSGFTHPLDTERGFEDEVARVLKQVFVLDCATRTEGYLPTNLVERRTVESVADLDFAGLYEAPLGERLETYLSVPESVVTDAMPIWNRVTYVRPEAESVDFLPHLVDDLSLIRTKSAQRGPSAASNETPETTALRSFKRGLGLDGRDLEPPSARDEAAAGIPDAEDYVPLPEPDAVERAWVGDGTPVHGAKLLPSAFDAEFEPTDGVIDVTVVCNDEEMREELNVVSEVYGGREELPLDVEFRFDVSTDELRALLAADHDLFHFVGHIDGRGFACRDGSLDAATLSETGARMLLLNACRSHDQGIALVEAGARAAIVSWGDVDNRGAIEVGETFARLLNYGFGVGSALEIVEEHTAIGRHYVVVGDPSASIAQCKDGGAMLTEVTWESDGLPAPDDELDVTVRSHPVGRFGVGSAVRVFSEGGETPGCHVVPGSRSFTNTCEEVAGVFGGYSAPIVVENELCWTDEVFDGNRMTE